VRKLTLSMAILAALMPGRGYPLGLGELELNSALNQELEAEVEVLSAEAEDIEQLIVKLASREAFSRSGIDRPYLLQQLKFKTFLKNNKPYISITTKKPIREPFLSFLVEIDWPEGHMLREYTILLDPPVYSGSTASTSAPAPTSADNGRPFIDPADSNQAQPAYQQVEQQQSASPAESDYATPQATHSAQVAPEAVAQVAAPEAIAIEPEQTQSQVTYQPVPQYQEVSGSYRVKESDTLWSMANRMRPDNSVSVEQMMLALVRENPEAFIKENINGVKRGYILRMPDRASITALDRQQALAKAREHSALWREYRQAMSGSVPASSLESETETEAEAGVSDEASAKEEDGQLSIVSASDSDGSETAASAQDPNAQQLKKLRNELSLAQESLESERLEKEELRTRLSELEQRVQNVLQMDDGELAKLQQDLEGVKEQAEKPAEVIAVDETPTEEVATEEAVVEEAVVEQPTDELAAEEPVTEESEVTPDTEEALFVDEFTETVEEEVVVEEQPVVQQTDVPAFAQQKPKSFIGTLLEDTKMLAVLLAGILAVLATVGMILRRRRINKPDEEWTDLDEPEIDKVADEQGDEATVQIEAMDQDSTAEMPAPTEDELESGFDDTHIEALSNEDISASLEDTVISLAEEDEVAEGEEDSDDVIAEADVYLAYGIYQQAEELLRNAIDQNPNRDDYRMKLLETHFAGKNSDAFAALAEEVKPRKVDNKSYWDRVVAMGRELCPDNAMFNEAGGIELPDFDTDDLLPKKPETTDLELDAEDSATPDLDLSFDAELPSDEPEDDATQILSEPIDLGAELEAQESSDDTGEDLAGDTDLEFDLGNFDEELEDAGDSVTEADDDSASLDIDEDFSLDFDASDLGFEEEEESEKEDVSAEMDMDLDSDIDLDSDAAEEVSAELDMDLESDIELGSDTAEEVSAELDMDLESDIDLDTDTAEDLSADMDLDSGIDLDTDITEEISAEVDMDLDSDIDLDIDTAEADMDLDADLDLAVDLDIDTAAEEDVPPVSDDTMAILDAGLDMDASEDLEVALDDSADIDVSLDDDDDFDISELSEDVDEVGTKLDLAKAYIDMGDNEGAKSILEEVKVEGNEEQQQQAEELLNKAG